MTAAPPLHPELASYVSQYQAARERAQALTAGLADAALAWSPARGRWSIGDCIRHLCVAGFWYLPLIDDALLETRARGHYGDGASRRPAFGEWFVRSIEPPPRFRVKAPGRFLSHPRVDGRPVLPLFLELQDELIQRVRDAAGLDIGRVTIRSPVTPLVRLTIAQVFALNATHERRHLWQAEQVRAHPEFPRHA